MDHDIITRRFPPIFKGKYIYILSHPTAAAIASRYNTYPAFSECIPVCICVHTCRSRRQKARIAILSIFYNSLRVYTYNLHDRIGNCTRSLSKKSTSAEASPFLQAPSFTIVVSRGYCRTTRRNKDGQKVHILTERHGVRRDLAPSSHETMGRDGTRSRPEKTRREGTKGIDDPVS